MMRQGLKWLVPSALYGLSVFAFPSLGFGQANLPAPPVPLPSAQGAAPNQVSAAASSGLEDLKKRLDALEKQNQDLLKQNQEFLQALQRLQTQPQPPAPISSTASPSEAGQSGPLGRDDVQKLVSDYLTQRDVEKKAADEQKQKEDKERGFIVGKNLGVVGRWVPAGIGSGTSQMWFETPDKAFRMHFGGRIQPDIIFSAGTINDAGNNVEQGKGGTGPFLEGFNFRRARLEMDGWLYEQVDFFVEFDWANTPFNTGVRPGNRTLAGTPTGTQPFSNILNAPAPTDVWAAINYLPVIGSVRFGNMKPPIGLDHLTSSRYLDFMERSTIFDVYYNRNNGFEPGLMIFNNTEDERFTWALFIGRTSNGGFAFNQGGGAWDYTGRLTWLPYFQDNGRYMVHLGLGGKYQTLDRSTGVGVAALNGRWLLRNSQSGFQDVVQMMNLEAHDQAIIQPEIFINLGSLSIQAEYLFSRVGGVTKWNSQLTPTALSVPTRSFFSHGGYIQAMYFLTGEYRPYGKTYVHSSGPAPTRFLLNRNFFWARGEDYNPFQCGAWQVGARYSYSNLNDGDLVGGIVNEVTLGLNWFINPNLRVQWNYDIGHRNLAAGGGTSNGYYQGAGMGMRFDF